MVDGAAPKVVASKAPRSPKSAPAQLKRAFVPRATRTGAKKALKGGKR